MARYTAWKTVIDGVETKHRSENKTYTYLNEQAPHLAEGVEITVYVQEQHAGDRWFVFERHVIREGRIHER